MNFRFLFHFILCFHRLAPCAIVCSQELWLTDWMNTTEICILRHGIRKLEHWKGFSTPSAFCCLKYIVRSPKCKGPRHKEVWAFLWISKSCTQSQELRMAVWNREKENPLMDFIYNLRENLGRLPRATNFFEFWIKSYHFRAFLLRMDWSMNGSKALIVNRYVF